MTDDGTSYYKKSMVPHGEEYVDSAPYTVTDSIVVEAPVAAVWAVLDNTPGFTAWFPGVKSGSMVNPADKGVNAKRLAQLNRTKYFEKMVAYREEEAWGFTMLEATSGACRSITEVVYLESIDDTTTKVTYKGGFDFAGVFKLLNGMMTNQIAKTWANALAGLKTHIESQRSI